MWKEIKAMRMVGSPDRSIFAEEYEVIEERELETGETVELHKKERGVLRKKEISMVEVEIVDDDTAKVKLRRPEEPIVRLGRFETSGFKVQNLDGVVDWRGVVVRAPVEQRELERQDVFIYEKGNVHGVVWLNEDGERPEPIYETPGRSFYEGEEDEIPEGVREFLNLDW